MNHIYYIPETDMLILTWDNFGNFTLTFDEIMEPITYVYKGEL